MPRRIQPRSKEGSTTAEARSEHTIGVSPVGEDGQPVASLDGKFEAEPGPDNIPGEHAHIPMIFHMRSVPISATGVYSLDIVIDGDERGSLSFAVRKAEGNPALPPSRRGSRS